MKHNETLKDLVRLLIVSLFLCFTIIFILSIYEIYTNRTHVRTHHVSTCAAKPPQSSETGKRGNDCPSDLRKEVVSLLAGFPNGETKAYRVAMSAPLSSSEPRRSEMGHGRGLSVHPLSDAQTIRGLPWKTESDKHDGSANYRAQLRSDPTNGAEDLSTMPFVKGNPDMFGPSLPLVRESQYEPPAAYPQPVLRYGVDRQD